MPNPPVPLPLEPRAGETRDSLLGGELQVIQARGGYRFNLDPILLAHFAAGGRAPLKGRAIDLGTGTGVIALILASRFAVDTVGLELQPSLFQLAERNVKLNRCERRIQLVLGDWRRVREQFSPGSFAHALSNPPYRARAAGRVSPHAEKALARHEVEGSLDDLAEAARYLLEDRGSLYLVYPAQRLGELLHSLQGRQLEPKRLRFVHPRVSRPAKLVLMRAVKRARAGIAVDPPLCLHPKAGPSFTPEVEQMLGGKGMPARGHTRPAAPAARPGPPTR